MDVPSSELDRGPGVFASAFRYKWLIVITVLLGVLAGYAFTARKPTMYEAVARVYLPALSNGQDSGPSSDPSRRLLNQTAIMSSTLVLQDAARRAGIPPDADVLSQRVKAQASVDSDLITVRAKEPTARGAAVLADSVISAYTTTLDQTNQQQAQADVVRLRAKENIVQSQLAGLRSNLAANPTDKALQTEFNAVAGQLGNLVTQELKLTESTNQPSDIVGLREAAEIPKSPVQPKPARGGIVGGLAGLVAGFGLAWWLGRRRFARQWAGGVAPDPAGATAAIEAARAAELAAAAPTPNNDHHLAAPPDLLKADAKQPAPTSEPNGAAPTPELTGGERKRSSPSPG